MCRRAASYYSHLTILNDIGPWNQQNLKLITFDKPSPLIGGRRERGTRTALSTDTNMAPKIRKKKDRKKKYKISDCETGFEPPLLDQMSA
jgi:hypothetical protein